MGNIPPRPPLPQAVGRVGKQDVTPESNSKRHRWGSTEVCLCECLCGLCVVGEVCLCCLILSMNLATGFSVSDK